MVILNSNNAYDWYMQIKTGVLNGDKDVLLNISPLNIKRPYADYYENYSFAFLTKLKKEFGLNITYGKLNEKVSGRFDRNIGVFTLEEQRKLWDSKVTVIGCGGLGGLLSECLVRSGVGNLVLVDGDVYEESNLNRQVGALSNTIGCNKAEVMKERLLTINPNVNIIVYNQFLNDNNLKSIIDLCNYVACCVDGRKNKQFVCDRLSIPYIVGGVVGSSFWSARFDNPKKYNYAKNMLEIHREINFKSGQLYAYSYAIMQSAVFEAGEVIQQILSKEEKNYYVYYDIHKHNIIRKDF